MAGSTTSSVTRPSVGSMMKSAALTTTTVRPWTARFTRPSCSSCESASTSLVMRVITRPARSSV